ncbi:Glucose-responsive transcription factor, partial [Ascosphaera atra]
MKRGPSKGYIKELAERINSLESQIHPGAHGPNSMSPHPPQAHPGQEMQYGAPLSAESPHGYQGFAPGIDNAMLGQDGAGGRKRTYSMSEGIAGGFMASPGPNANFAQQQSQGMQNVNMALRTPSAVAGWPVQGAGANGNKEGVMTQPQAPQTQSEQRDLYATSYPNATEAAKPAPPFWAQD